jgi:hypothetical protein
MVVVVRFVFEPLNWTMAALLVASIAPTLFE